MKEIKTYSLDKIISIDESSISPFMMLSYSRCDLGKRCKILTDDNKAFTKFTMLCAISNSKCIGYKVYEKGGMNKERFVEFLKEFIFDKKIKDHLIVLDNAGSHKNDYVRDAITESGNKYLYEIPYNPNLNPIESWFSQVKHYLKMTTDVVPYEKLVKKVKKAIDKVSPENYKNYFLYNYKKEELKLPDKNKSTKRQKTPKIYKK